MKAKKSHDYKLTILLVVSFFTIIPLLIYVFKQASPRNNFFDSLIPNNKDISRYEKLLKTWQITNKVKQNVLIQLFKTETTYSVSIIINKLCPTDLRYKYFNESDIYLLNKARIGPDEILVFLEGPSIQVEVAASENFCNKYHAYFQIPLSGAYRIKVVHLRGDYSASANRLFFYPKFNYEVLIDELLPKDYLSLLIPRPCSPLSIFDTSYPIHAINGYWVSSESNLTVDPIYLGHSCSGEIPSNKEFKLMTTHIRLTESEKSNNGCSEEITKFKWNRRICAYKKKPQLIQDNDLISEYVDMNHPLKTDMSSTNHDFSTDKAILFVGGIHIRSLGELFLKEVCKYNSFIRLDTTSMKKVQTIELSKSAAANYRSKHHAACKKDETKCEMFDHGCTGLTFGYLAEPYCKADMTVHFSQFNYVVLNCGHIPASSTHYTYTSYRNDVSSLFNSILSAQLPPTTLLFWIESLAPPLHIDEHSIQRQDQRTYHRMLIYHQIVQDEILHKGLKNRIALVPGFQSTLALFDKMCDCEGYPPTVIVPQLMSLIDSIHKSINRMGLNMKIGKEDQIL